MEFRRLLFRSFPASYRLARMTRLIAILVLALGLTACGFHLRGAPTLPPDLGPVRVIATDPYSPLAESLSVALEQAGATPAAEDAARSEEHTSELQSLMRHSYAVF